MALTIEDGTGVTGADSYADVSWVTTFLSLRSGDPGWDAASLQAQETALRRAADYLDAYHLNGQDPLLPAQGLAYPWLYPVSSAFALERIRRAAALLAPIALLGPLTAVGGADRPRTVRSETKKVGPLEKTVTYATDQPQDALYGRDLSFVSNLLAGIQPRAVVSGGLVLGRAVRS